MIELAIVPSRVLRVLLIVIGALLALSVIGQVTVHFLPASRIRQRVAELVYIDEELSLPTLYASMMLLVGAVLVAAIAHAGHRSRQPHVGHWAILSVTLVILAIDESVGLHERSWYLRGILDVGIGPWVVPGAIGVTVFALFFIPFLRHLPRPTRRGFLAAGALFVGGALAFEVVGWAYADRYGQDNMLFTLILTVEEALEMIGVAVLVYTLLTYVSLGFPDASWRVGIARELDGRVHQQREHTLGGRPADR